MNTQNFKTTNRDSLSLVFPKFTFGNNPKINPIQWLQKQELVTLRKLHKIGPLAVENQGEKTTEIKGWRVKFLRG